MYMANMPDLSRIPSVQSTGFSPQQIDAEVRRWNEVIARQAQSHGVVLVDLHSRWEEAAQRPEYFSVDGFHPGAEGCRRLAEAF